MQPNTLTKVKLEKIHGGLETNKKAGFGYESENNHSRSTTLHVRHRVVLVPNEW